MYLKSCLLILPTIIVFVWSKTTCLDKDGKPVTTCTMCIWQQNCEWCTEVVENGKPAIGCVRKGSYNCRSKVISAKSTSLVRINKYLPLSSRVQLAPQEMTLTANPSVESKLQFQVNLANVPVDIYFVMDLSKSMAIHRDNLVKATESIASKIQHLTPNFRLGFGSFSDKPTAPFAAEKSYYEARSDKPAPYAFHHQSTLNPDPDIFRTKVKDAVLSANIDSPESGLDALLQAMVCEDYIGWRPDVRKIIMFITDESPHYSLDGLLGGIINPQRGQCWLNSGNRFSPLDGLDNDYSSFGLIREELRKRNMMVIFAVDEFMDAIYRQLSNFIQKTENVGHLTSDATSLEQIITQQYKSIKSRIMVSSEQGSLRLLSLTSNCKRQQESQNVLICSDIQEDEAVTYTATLTVDEQTCGKSQGNATEFNLVGFPGDKLKISFQCEECDCGEVVRNSRTCEGRGDLICGGCQCREGFSGRSCECDTSGLSFEEIQESCKQNPEDDDVCNGFGNCLCGVSCSCDEDHLGEFCQCDFEDCPVDSLGNICGGKGSCQCNNGTTTTCTCNHGWSGEDCSCPKSVETCKDSVTETVCFGRGSCRCGKCICDENFGGQYCQRDLHIDTCSKLEPCIKAKFLISNSSSEEVEQWENECSEKTKHNGIKLFGDFLDIGCLLDDLFYLVGASNCKQVMENIDDEGDENDEVQGPSRGDLVDLKSKARVVGVENLELCVSYHAGCEVTYYHDHLEDDHRFDPRKPKVIGNVFVVHRNVTENLDMWTPLVRCSTIPMAIVMGSTIGIVFVIVIALIVTAIVIVNINDLRSYKHYQALREANEARLGENRNPLYVEQRERF